MKKYTLLYYSVYIRYFAKAVFFRLALLGAKHQQPDYANKRNKRYENPSATFACIMQTAYGNAQ